MNFHDDYIVMDPLVRETFTTDTAEVHTAGQFHSWQQDCRIEGSKQSRQP